jgi:hypothetical protein
VTPLRCAARDKASMSGPGRSCERFVALFLLGVLLFAPPLLVVFNKPTRILGVPALYLYLFAAWAFLIALVALLIRRAAGHDRAGPARGLPARDSAPPAEGPTDA